MYLAYAFLSAIFAALVTVLGKLGLKKVDPVFATSIRAVIMAIFFVILVFVLQKAPKGGLSTLSTKDLILVIGAGVCGALSWLFYFQALKLGSASKVASIDKLSLVFIVIFSALFLGENLNIKSVFGVVLMMLGVYMITL